MSLPVVFGFQEVKGMVLGKQYDQIRLDELKKE